MGDIQVEGPQIPLEFLPGSGKDGGVQSPSRKLLPEKEGSVERILREAFSQHKQIPVAEAVGLASGARSKQDDGDQLLLEDLLEDLNLQGFSYPIMALLYIKAPARSRF
ncbi:MAG: hypothetical protein QHH30_03430, partial [candidate division NC10 bacterium]|nr:hypothetical protein [candidate division NC10 bacterium]